MTGRISVVGGAYGEACSFPRRTLYRGSGGRAAAVLHSLGSEVAWHTLTGPELQPEFAAIAKHIGYELHAGLAEVDVWFNYRFPLGRPDIWPSEVPRHAHAGTVTADNLLVFGMLEGRPKTVAKRAVYDPQDGSSARAYGDNGSTAQELAMVVSLSEGKALTGQGDAEAIALVLLSEPTTSVVIVKCGPQGALVRTCSSAEWIRPFPTERVYKIGSGDVFSAAFAQAWLVWKQAPGEAAWFASRATAEYVNGGQDRFTIEQMGDMQAQARFAQMKARQSGARTVPDKPIYLAGPFFTAAQQWAIDEARAALQDMGFTVFSPIHEVGEGLPEDVARKDLEGLDRSLVVLALIDGLDAGTLFEIGYAVARGIPVVAVGESVAEGDLTMLLGTGCHVTDDLTTGIYAACWKMMGDA
ncbi:hypothetical protein GCM10007320_34920 [Pseudorhodoferax aquiterrae]|uniref:Carbohydrate kinase PfkB domain-containing protein n=1 Tax=Pseudorhodoferax aquiterrae TaxID=747304 RepID=A0ABQ3G3V4_9BURK|nr:PfkB family carbohydrate kinase [Pseudorhodoferax aquiterrae]GHC88077.1 hypothetical protein GCM10007320_34920 [Pseudorhodoferax aquiterrae]